MFTGLIASETLYGPKSRAFSNILVKSLCIETRVADPDTGGLVGSGSGFQVMVETGFQNFEQGGVSSSL